MSDFEGKVVIVTGGASGIGRTTSEFFARDGAKVVVSDVDEGGGQDTVRRIRETGGVADFLRTDVANPAECEALVRWTVEKYGKLDVAFNNAGIGGEQNSTANYSLAGWQRVLGINLSGVFYCMKYEIAAMLAKCEGAIVNMSSILGEVGFAGSPAYVAAKHGILGLTKNAALEYSSKGIRVNAVGPAFIRTPLIAALEEDPQALSGLVAAHPIGRLGEPGEVAELVLWLSSSRASFVTGAYYPVDGGYLAR